MHGGQKMAVVFTCTVCNTRSARQFTKKSYDEGVVLIRCPGCDNLHLFAVRTLGCAVVCANGRVGVSRKLAVGYIHVRCSMARAYT
jgi:hypothetical protein